MLGRAVSATCTLALSRLGWRSNSSSKKTLYRLMPAECVIVRVREMTPSCSAFAKGTNTLAARFEAV